MPKKTRKDREEMEHIEKMRRYKAYRTGLLNRMVKQACGRTSRSK